MDAKTTGEPAFTIGSPLSWSLKQVSLGSTERAIKKVNNHNFGNLNTHSSSSADSESTRPYEALSYVWASENKPRSISIDGCDLPVGENLYAALSHLRDRSIERTIWIDAICINQRCLKEKGQQFQSMAKIYTKASRVIVWLGGATPDSGQALEEIRIAAEQRTKPSPTKPSINESAILKLLEGPWFQRIWVLQEVAAALNVLIKCGPTEISGYAFCSGLSKLNLSYETRPDLSSLIRSVSYLIRGAAFRPRCATGRSGRFSLGICPLGLCLAQHEL
ncbi:hypothetical protein FPOA_11978 [Fusarium poae]|uniref:Heterokaryon incompatibility domain-containing protein n=1 Tax=Fusarium poae TaxID=36050 RepID=A0A1B8A8Z4_FUSPO|nr:hypothetical protein FPOA_12507 [Fusarium poae]OBS17573.1 hypothetical protein FPOA_11978 [Fusarium poae]